MAAYTPPPGLKSSTVAVDLDGYETVEMTAAAGAVGGHTTLPSGRVSSSSEEDVYHAQNPLKKVICQQRKKKRK